MKNIRTKILIVSLFAGFVMFGCGQRAQNSGEAIELSKVKATVEEQAKYLIQQANSFINSDQFD